MMHDPKTGLIGDGVTLSACLVANGSHIRRHSPRPVNQRNAQYQDQFDWETIFYDVYRVGEHIVFQGPPFFNLLPPLKTSTYFREHLRWYRPANQQIERNRLSEIWIRDAGATVRLDCDLGQFDIAVQPNLSHLFANRRVIHTLSKNNDIRWIRDWIRFYVAIHGADAVLLYDNSSTLYETASLQRELRAAFPNIFILIVDWPFKYGPQGGEAGAVNGVESPWDSDYCQTGSLQHARFRFLQSAKSALNVDIDEMVVSSRGCSIFEATEAAPGQFIRFDGQWISTSASRPVTPADCLHGDFFMRDTTEDGCPPKWCVVPVACHHRKHTWSVHNLFGSPHNKRISDEFVYRHVKGISNNWKYNRWDCAEGSPGRFVADGDYKAMLEKAGLRGGA